MRPRGCIGFKENGQPCHTPKLQEGDYCFWHSPAHADQVSEARRLGGLRRRREVAVSDAFGFAGLETMSDIHRLLEVAVVDTLGLENSISRARTLAYLATTAIKLLEVEGLEERLAALEVAVNSQKILAQSVFDVDSVEGEFTVEAEE